MAEYLTLTQRFDYSADPIKGSRFLGVLLPCDTEAEALAGLAELQHEHKDASHHCWAYLLVDGTHRCQDDGEPRGSAGKPILAQLEGHETFGVMAVVMRWFGGTKLGVGGLIRAYGGTAGKALDRAPLVTVHATVDLSIEHAYTDTNAVQSVLANLPHTVLDTHFESSVRLRIRVAEDLAETVMAQLRERTSGRIG